MRTEEVRKIRRGPAGPDESSRFDVEQLVRDVKSVYDGYSADSLEEMWQYKEYVMARVAQDGGNEYERHRKHVRGQYSVGRYLGVCLPWSMVGLVFAGVPQVCSTLVCGPPVCSEMLLQPPCPLHVQNSISAKE